MQHNYISNPAVLRIDRVERHPRKVFSAPFVKDKPFDFRAGRLEHATNAGNRGNATQIEWHELSSVRKKLQNIGQLCSRELFLETLWHERFAGPGQLIDVVAQDSAAFAF